MARKDLIQYRRGTAAQWVDVNPILAAGEIGFATDANEVRVGNGASAWSDLAPIGGTVSEDTIAQAVRDYLAENPIEGAVIDDNAISTSTVWSSDKLADELAAVIDEIPTSPGDVGAAPTVHTHGQSDVAGLDDSLEGKVDASSVDVGATPDTIPVRDAGGKVKTETAEDGDDAVNLTQLNDALEGKANSTHTHDQGDITGLEAALDGKLETVTIEDIDASGSPSGSTYLRGDGTWATPPSGGGGGDTPTLDDVAHEGNVTNQQLRVSDDIVTPTRSTVMDPAFLLAYNYATDATTEVHADRIRMGILTGSYIDVAVEQGAAGEYQQALPAKSGTIALTSDVAEALGGLTLLRVTQAEYDLIPSPRPDDVLYVITP